MQAGGAPRPPATSARVRRAVGSCCSSTTTSSRRATSSHGTSHATTGGRAPSSGSARPARATPGLAELAVALWWHDHFELMAEAPTFTFTGMLSGNLSIPRSTFLELGGFDEGVGRLRREDWLFGLTALEAGLELAYAPDAVAVHEFSVPVRRRLPAAYAEGRGDALLIAERPGLERLLDRAEPFAGLRPAALACARGRRSRRARGQSRRPRPCSPGWSARACAGHGCAASKLSRPAAYSAGRRAGAPATPPSAAKPRLQVVVAESDDAAAAAPRVRRAVRAARGPGRPRPIVPDHGRWDRSVAAAAAGVVARAARTGARHGAQAAPARGDALPLVALGPATAQRKRTASRHRHTDRPRGRATRHWTAIDGLVRSAASDHVMIPMPRVVPTRAWLEASPNGSTAIASRSSSASTSALVGLGRAADARALQRPRALPDDRRPVPVRRRPPRLATSSSAAFGPAWSVRAYAAPLELAERALDAGSWSARAGARRGGPARAAGSPSVASGRASVPAAR